MAQVNRPASAAHCDLPPAAYVRSSACGICAIFRLRRMLPILDGAASRMFGFVDAESSADSTGHRRAY
jgi:hypothetical protein